MKNIETEVCAYSIESCLNAAKAGATRIELCASQPEGGTTPSASAIEMVVEIPDIEVSVMIRPRGGDFIYSDIEFEVMKRDVLFAKNSGADGVVFGILKADGSVDVGRTATLVEIAWPMEVTFHRAFDVTSDWRKALEDIIAAGCHRILTSGCNAKAENALDTLKEISFQANGRIEIMAGSGVNSLNAAQIVATGVDALHFSASSRRESLMKFRKAEVPMNIPGIHEFENQYADKDKIKAIVDICKNINKLTLK